MFTYNILDLYADCNCLQESPKYDLLDSSKESPCAMKAGCAVSPMFQEKHNESNAGDVPWCVHKYMEVSRKRGSEVSPVSRSKSLSVITDSAGNTDHGSDIIKILLTCGLVNKVRVSLLWSNAKNMAADEPPEKLDSS